jgi:hypothetical protein
MEKSKKAKKEKKPEKPTRVVRAQRKKEKHSAEEINNVIGSDSEEPANVCSSCWSTLIIFDSF